MKLYIATPINARQEPTMREKFISAKHRIAMIYKGNGYVCHNVVINLD